MPGILFISDARKLVPAPTSCADCVAKLQQLRNLVATSSSYAGHFFAQLITEYTDYYNSHQCAATPSGAMNPPVPANPLSDTVLGSAVVLQPGQSTAQPGQPVLSQPLPGSLVPGTQGTGTATGTGGFFSKIPTWAKWAGGGVLAAIIIALLVRKAKS